MCGICGTVGFSDKDLLKRMTAAMIHRGPDAEGFYTDDHVGLGVRRLKVIDLKTGDQPIHNEDKTLWMIYNGETYNFKKLRNNLIDKGHRFYTSSDTEVILHLYEEHGKDCLRYLNGMFAFAIWDAARKELFMARDRLGIKPLYYYHKDGRLNFASELKSLIQDRSIARDIDPKALGCFFSFLYIPAPHSIFEDIHKLPPAHCLIFKDGKIKIERYWDLSFDRQNIKSLSGFEYAGLIRQGLQDSVERRLVSDVPLGVFLSGGIDSSALVAMMRRTVRGPIKTFSIGYADKYSSFNELESAQYIAEHFSTEHKTFIVEPKIIETLPKVVWHLDEPFADSSAVLNFLISQEARRHVTVALNGIGGDEVFSGYPRYLGARLSLGYEKLPFFLRRLASRVADDFIKEDLTSQNKGGRLKRFLKGCLLNREERYIWWMQFFDKQALNDLFDRNTPALGLFDPFRIHKNYFYGVDTNDYLDQIFYTDVNTYLTDDLLFMGDRMSMANSLELRVPFCDHNLIELSASIASRTKMSNFRLKGLFKDSLIATLPAGVLNKPKQGFMVPVGRWIKEDLKEYTRDVLSQESLKKIGFLNYQSVRGILDEHFRGRRNHTHKIWALLIFKLWHDLYIKKT